MKYIFQIVFLLFCKKIYHYKEELLFLDSNRYKINNWGNAHASWEE